MDRDNSAGGLGDRDTVFRTSRNLSRHYHLALSELRVKHRKQKCRMNGVLPPPPCTASTSMKRFALPSGFKAGDWAPGPRQGHSAGDPAVCWASTPYRTCYPKCSLLMAAVGFVHTYVAVLRSVPNPKVTTAFVLRAGRKDKCRLSVGYAA